MINRRRRHASTATAGAAAALIALATASAPASATLVTTGTATDVTPHTATLHGTIDPQGSAVGYEFEYVDGLGRLDDGYDHETVGAGSLDAGAAPTEVSVAITGLEKGTPYFFRLVANGVDGQTQVFGTQPTAPSAEIDSTRSLSTTSEWVQGVAGYAGIPTDYHYDYGTTTAYGLSTPEQEHRPDPACSIDPLPTPPAPVPPPFYYTASMECWVGESDDAWGSSGVALDGLQPGTTYHVRLVAQNAVGTSYSTDTTFTTDGPPPPPPPPSPTPPRVIGDAVAGSTLTCSSDVPNPYGFAWLRDGDPIPDAGGEHYTLTAADAGHTIACRVTTFEDYLEVSATSDGVRVRNDAGRLTLLTRRAAVHGGVMSLLVACSDVSRACRAALTLRSAARSRRTVTLARTHLAVPARRRMWIRLRLNRTGLRMLRAATNHRLDVQVASGATRSTLQLRG